MRTDSSKSTQDASKTQKLTNAIEALLATSVGQLYPDWMNLGVTSNCRNGGAPEVPRFNGDVAAISTESDSGPPSIAQPMSIYEGPSVCTWVRDVLRDSFERTFNPGQYEPPPHLRRDHVDFGRYEDQFGVYTIKVRAKDPASAAHKLLAREFEETRKLERRATSSGSSRTKLDRIKSLIKRLQNWGDDGNPEHGAIELFLDLNDVLEDLFAARIVVLTQRNKMNIVRGMNLLVEAKSSHRLFRRVSETDGLTNVELVDDDTPWKFFNPPASFLYSSPEIFQRFVRVIPGLSSEDLSPAPDPELAWVESDTAREARAVLDELKENKIRLSFKSSGYATFQRIFKVSAAKSDASGKQVGLFHFELQIRTLLEDSWAEPEHRFIYKPGKPLSESTKALFRNYGANLHAADDLLQMISDRRQEELDTRTPLNEYSVQNYKRKRNPTLSFQGLDRDLRKVYSLRDQGYLSTARGYLGRAIDTYEAGIVRLSDEVEKTRHETALIVLRMEYAFTLCLQRVSSKIKDQRVRNLKEAKSQLEIALESAQVADLEVELFFIKFRLVFVEWLALRQDTPLEPEERGKSLSDRLVDCSMAFEDLAIELRKKRQVLSFDYEIEGLEHDISLLRWNSFLQSIEHRSREVPGWAADRVSSYANVATAVRSALDTAYGALRENHLSLQGRVFRKIMWQEGAEEHEREKLRVQRDIIWPLMWGANLFVYVCARMERFAQVLDKESLSQFEFGLNQSRVQVEEAFDTLKCWQNYRGDAVFRVALEFLDDASFDAKTLKSEQTRLESLVDEMGLEPLKILDSIFYYYENARGILSTHLGAEKLRRCYGMIEYRLVEISYLSDYGFEAKFHETVCGSIDRVGAVIKGNWPGELKLF